MPSYTRSICCILLTCLTLTACDEYSGMDILNAQLFRPKHKVNRPKILGYGPIKFGMKRQEALDTLGEYGQEIELPGEDKPSVYFNDVADNQDLDVWVFFEKKGDTVQRIEVAPLPPLTLIHDHENCKAAFQQYVDTFEQKYGQPDQKVNYKKNNLEYSARAMMTFTDSSSVRIFYKFGRQTNQCLIRVSYVGPWAS